MVAEVTMVMSDFRPPGFRAMAHAMAESDLREVLPHIDVPTLLLDGELDGRSPLPIAKALHAAIPESALVVIPDVGHQCDVEAPDRFNDEVRRFLTAL